MSGIINLRRARKAKARDAAGAEAAANRAKFGQTRAVREVCRLDAEREARKLAGARREDNAVLEQE